MSKVWAQRIVKLFLVVFFIAYGCRIGSDDEPMYKKVVEKRKIDGTTIELEQTAYYAGENSWLVTTDIDIDGRLRIYYRPDKSEMVYEAECDDIKKELDRQLEIMRPKFEEVYGKAVSIVNGREAAEECVEELESAFRAR